MKNLIYIFIILGFITSCKAQNPIVAREASFQGKSQGTYFKDINNEFNKFEGTWIYSDGNTSLTIVLQKKAMVYDGDEYYFDEIFGEYQYIENGVELINTIPSLIQYPNTIENRTIGGGYILTDNNFIVACDNCSPNERRVKLYFSDSERAYLSASVVLRYLSDGDPFGQGAQMTATIISTGGGILPEEDSPTSLRVPYGEYLMTKQ